MLLDRYYNEKDDVGCYRIPIQDMGYMSQEIINFLIENKDCGMLLTGDKKEYIVCELGTEVNKDFQYFDDEFSRLCRKFQMREETVKIVTLAKYFGSEYLQNLLDILICQFTSNMQSQICGHSLALRMTDKHTLNLVEIKTEVW